MQTLIQDVTYFITEWDDTHWPVVVRNIGRGARTIRHRADGSPYMRRGGDVLLKYSDGLVHRVSSKYFTSLNPRLAAWVPNPHGC